MAKAKPKAVAGKIWTTRQFSVSGKPVGQEISVDTPLEVRVFETEPATVTASYGLTLNLGNYESARCDAGVTLPCYREEVESAFKEAWSIAEEQVSKQVADIRKGQR